MFKLFRKIFPGAPPADDAAGRTHQLRGNALLADGQLDDAAACYRQAIAVNPGQADGHVSLAYVLKELHRLDEAEIHLRQAIELAPDSADSIYLLATVLRAQGRHDDAIVCFRKALALKPDFDTIYAELGELLLERDCNSQAQQVLDAGLARDPGAARLLYLMGNVHARAGAHDQAVACFTKALVTAPDYADLHYHLGAALQAQDRLDDAIVSYQRAIALQPDNRHAYINLGSALLGMKRYEEALANYDYVLLSDPECVESLVNRSSALHKLRRYTEALESCDRALAFKPGTIEALLNRGAALSGLNRNAEALDNFSSAMKIEPDRATIFVNCGTALLNLGRYAEALEHWQQAMAIEPDLADAHFNEGMCQLLLGQFEPGWQKYEWRWKTDQFRRVRQTYSQPIWLGEASLSGKTILLYHEQGLGDTIQFCRYAPLVAAKGATVLLLVPKTLKKLLSNLAGVSQIFTHDEPLPEFDYHCPLLSLPLAFKTSVQTIPHTKGYINADPDYVDRWHTKLGGKTRPRVGLVWSGSLHHLNDQNRSVPLTQFMQLTTGDVEFVSLQQEIRPEDWQTLSKDKTIAYFGHELTDFTDTAGLISNVDLVISVDTSVAHLAGAMGKPVWIILPSNPDWRWMLDCTESPWYPSARLFRRAQDTDITHVISEISRQLTEFTINAK